MKLRNLISVCLFAAFVAACGDLAAIECNQGQQRCNGLTIQKCNDSTGRWKDVLNCLEAGYDQCALVDIRADGKTVCRGPDDGYEGCVTRDETLTYHVRQAVCIDSARRLYGLQ